MGATSKTTDVTANQNFAGTANQRDINSAYSGAFYDYLTGQGDGKVAAGLAAGAKEQADAAFSPFGVAMNEYAGMQSEQQRRATEQRLATSGLMGAGSGAANAAIGQAIASPYAAANVQMQQNYGNMYQNAYGNLLGNLSGMSQQQIVAPQFQTQATPWGQFLDYGMSLASSYLSDAGRKK